ncbi:uncharacterized protein [Zea mays]|uniref:uncharacterized protein isoform X5 n=1 Tax=Zea mays TaxID=4577 RepID=UPI0004DE7D98|nr:uncharacterized protein LOC100276804 isoform X5 [Zea mays]
MVIDVSNDESDEEVPQAIPLFPKADDDKSKESKCDVEKPAATESSKPKVSLEETKDPEKHEVDVGGTDDDESDEDFVDSEEGESDDDESTKSKNRPSSLTLEDTSREKVSDDAKKNIHVHVEVGEDGSLNH